MYRIVSDYSTPAAIGNYGNYGGTHTGYVGDTRHTLSIPAKAGIHVPFLLCLLDPCEGRGGS